VGCVLNNNSEVRNSVHEPLMEARNAVVVDHHFGRGQFASNTHPDNLVCRKSAGT
jgi:hypothetical protein